MWLRWDALFGAIVFFALFLFSPLLEALGPDRTTICTGILGVAIIKVIECRTEDKCCSHDENDDDDIDF